MAEEKKEKGDPVSQTLMNCNSQALLREAKNKTYPLEKIPCPLSLSLHHAPQQVTCGTKLQTDSKSATTHKKNSARKVGKTQLTTNIIHFIYF